jgi:type IV pilus assembly protein PilV
MSLRHPLTAAHVRVVTGAEATEALAIGLMRDAAHPSGASGFTLLEVLVALLVLSVGTLGCVALQLNALQATHSAYQRSLASLIAADVGERLWQGLGDGQIDTAWLSDWRQRRSCETGEGHVCLPELDVTIEGSAGSRVVTVSWAETRFEDAAGGRSQLEYVIELLPERLP